MSSLNEHIEKFLEYYCGLSYAPQYAVLIKGAWGVGKTHLVDRFFKNIATTSKTENIKTPKYLYVSLYGITNTREIEDAFFIQLHPVLGSKGMRFAGKITKGLLKTSLKIDLDGDSKADGSVSSQIPDINLPEYIKNSHRTPLVFDDLERCQMPIKDILGYINNFAEHDGCKVVILSDEDKISEETKKSYALIKEKLIGKTFEVRPEFEDAFNFFLESIDSKDIKKFYRSKLSDIRMLFDQSKSQNLRTLQRTMWDFERFASILTSSHLANDEAMRDIFRVFFAMSFEIKAGRITGEDIANFGQYYWADILSEDDRKNPTATQQLKKTYPEVPFDQTLLSHEILANVLGNSIIDKKTIHESLDQHQYFSSPESEAPWRIVWDATRRDQELVSKSIIKLEEQFTNREFTVRGEILQVAGIRLWLARIRAIEQSMDEIVQEFNVYVDDLYRFGKLEITDNKFDKIDRYSGGYGGLGFHEMESEQFRSISNYLNHFQIKALEDSYEDKAKALMDEMAEDTQLYFLRLCVNNTDEQLYYDTPILKYIEPSKFVDKFLTLSPDQQHISISVFKQRYEHPEITKKLTSELAWLKKVLDILRMRAVQMQPIPKHAIENYIEWYIEPSLEKVLKENPETS